MPDVTLDPDPPSPRSLCSKSCIYRLQQRGSGRVDRCWRGKRSRSSPGVGWRLVSLGDGTNGYVRNFIGLLFVTQASS